VLFNGRDLDGWLKVRGPVAVAKGTIRMTPGPEGKSILLSRKVDAADGILEATIDRRGEAQGGAYTLSVRLHADLLDWRAVYVVCRPDRVEIMRGGRNEAPRGTARGEIEPVEVPELWRIRMQGPSVRCYRFGKLVAEYTDPIDEPGTVCITADGVDIEVLKIRYRPLASHVAHGEAKSRPE
jgi:hypothetical protein